MTLKKLKLIIPIIILWGCSQSSDESNNSQELGVSIIDTLKYGDYYRDQGNKDNIYFRIYEAETDTIISHLVDGYVYQVRFEVPRLDYLKVVPRIINNGSIERTDSTYTLKVNRTDESNYMQIDFELDLKGDSIIIQNRDWSDSTKTTFVETFVGFKPRGAFRISIKDRVNRS